jgi:hypothetical protein
VLCSICFGVIKDGKSPSKEVCGWEHQWRIVQQAMFNYQRVSMFHINTFFVGVLLTPELAGYVELVDKE